MEPTKESTLKFEPYQIERIEEARPRIEPLVNLLRRPDTYWHRTSLIGLKGIFRTGHIEPNDGRFPHTYGQSRLCMARHLQAVSLFDFNTRPVDEILLRSDRWVQFFSDCGPATFVIELESSALESNLVVAPGVLTHEEMLRYKSDGLPYVPMYLPAVEAWYREAIPVSAFRRYLAFRRHTDFESQQFDVDIDLAELAALNAAWERPE